MSGLLTRLGAQATGHGWAVRSDVRLPFVPGQPMARPTLEDTTDRAIAMDPGDERAASQGTVARSAPRSRPQPTTAPETAHTAYTAHTAHPPRPGTAWAGDPTSPSAREPLPPPMAAVEPPPAVLPTPLLPPHKTPAPQVSPARMALAPHEQRPTTGDLPPALLTAQPPAPQRHRASLPRTASATVSGSPFAQPQSAVASGGETEVHIHIGRIEVTALQEAPPPKPVTRERAQPMSLETYLDRRKGVR